MSYQYVNGYSNPKFKILNGNQEVETISLDYCGVNGLVESNEFIYVNHNLIDYSTLQTIKGLHIHFTLDYVDYSDLNNTLSIQNIINYAIAGFRVFLYPRAETYRNFEVILELDSVDIGIMKGGEKSIGNKLLQLKFRTKYLQSNLAWINPNNISLIGVRNFNKIGIF